MSGARRLTLVLAAMATALLLAGGAALAASLTGTNGNDTINGTEVADTINGGLGNDTLSGLAGDDSVLGGDGADKVFAGDAAHNRLVGNDLVAGQDGPDTVVGGVGTDDLRGGNGADTIVDGPWDDSSTDTVYGGPENDNINSAGIPAHRDVIYCGTGTDTVEADAADAVSADCENVSRFSPPADDPNPAEAGEDTPASLPDPSESFPDDGDDGAQPGADESGYREFKCTLPPQWKSNKYCSYLNNVYDGEFVGVGLRSVEGNCRDLNFIAWAEGKYLGVDRLGECSDRYDTIYHGKKIWSGPRTVRVYGRSAGDKYTTVYGYLT